MGKNLLMLIFNNLEYGFIIIKNVLSMIKKELCFEYFKMIVIVKVRKNFLLIF